MSVSPPDDPDTGAHGRGARDDRFVQVSAMRDAMVAGRDFHVRDLHVHVAESAKPTPGTSETAETPEHVKTVGATEVPVMPTVARSSYLQQVRRIAPPEPPGLRDREDELAELAGFCLAAEGPSYAWWRAGAWAGKSALLSTFVLRPPAPVAERVRIVSFFITARLAAQDNREAFTLVLAEQLAELTGQTLPGALPEATREGYLLDLLAEAAGACQRAGGRLVLVIDGLDEDRGVTTGPDAHSIAGLLPPEPPAGMRVIVAGRPNPPVPDDVPDWHPLRDEAIVRPLKDSPHARDIRRLGQQELHRLLKGDAPGRDLLGLLTAARGGLSVADLAELADVPLWETEEILHTVAGRTFTRRASRWTPETGPAVYLLGHEELQVAAERYLAAQLPGYRDRLHAWAGSYQDRGWPPETPEYLLGGYHSLLTALGDLDRMTACATDTARHDRMLEVTSGDAVGLAETRTTLDHIVAQDPPDLIRALAVARHRDQLTERNSNIPAMLPGVWAALGQVTRAEALSGSIADPYKQALALTSIGEALVKTGKHGHAVAIAEQTQTPVRLILYPEHLVEALARIAGLFDRAGQVERAAAVAEQAETAARRNTYFPSQQISAMALVVKVLVDAGQHQRAAALAGQAETAARSITTAWPEERAQALARVAEAVAIIGHRDKAATIAAEAEHLACTATTPHSRASALMEVVTAFAKAGNLEKTTALAVEAEHLGRTAFLPEARASYLSSVSEALIEVGNQAQVARIVGQAETTARTIAGQWYKDHYLGEAAVVLAKLGQYQQAAEITQKITETYWKAAALAGVADSFLRAGRSEDAAAIAEQAETAARSINSTWSQVETLTSATVALAEVNKLQHASAAASQAVDTARRIDDPDTRASALSSVAVSLAESMQREKATAVAEEAATVASSIADPWHRAMELMQASKALISVNDYQQATTMARRIEEAANSIASFVQPRAFSYAVEALANARQYQEALAIAESFADTERVYALIKISEAMANSGELQRGAALMRQAESAARSLTSSTGQARTLAQIAISLAGAERQQAAAIARHAESIVLDLPGIGSGNASALSSVSKALAATGQHEHAEATARAVTADDPIGRDDALSSVAQALAKDGQCERARKVAHDITDPEKRTTALALIAKALARAGETRRAARLTAEACATGLWINAVAPTLLLAPSAASEILRILDIDFP